LSAALTVVGAAPAWAHGVDEHAAAPAGWGAVVTRCLVLVASALVAGVALVRPFSGPPGRATRRLVLVAAFVAGARVLVSVLVDHVPWWLAAIQVAATVAVPFVLDRSVAAPTVGGVLILGIAAEAVAGHGGWAYPAGIAHAVAASVWVGAAGTVATAEAGTRRAALRRLTPAAVAGGVVVSATGVVQAWLDGLRLDATTAGSAFGRIVLLKAGLLVAVAVLGLIIQRRAARGSGPGRRLASAATVGLAVALVAGGALAAVDVPPAPPTPGTPLVRSVALGAAAVPVAVVPQRPGWNLVHVGAADLAVGADADHLVPAPARPGVTGGWALVQLPAGPSRLWLRGGGRLASLRVDTGRAEAGPAGITGPDGPECVSAALGALAAGAEAPVDACPADRLTAADDGSLRALVGYLAGRGVHTVAVAADSSPRSVAAAAVVRDAAQRQRLAVLPAPEAGSALVVVSGWSAADATLRGVIGGEVPGAGAYLAPWLADAPLLAHGSGAVVALRYDPRDPDPLDYAGDLHDRFVGEAASAAGYQGWLAARGVTPIGHTHLYAASTISFLPAEFGHAAHEARGGWLPGGTITRVTPPLD
jgi:hypothetical protein